MEDQEFICAATRRLDAATARAAEFGGYDDVIDALRHVVGVLNAMTPDDLEYREVIVMSRALLGDVT